MSTIKLGNCPFCHKPKSECTCYSVYSGQCGICGEAIAHCKCNHVPFVKQKKSKPEQLAEEHWCYIEKLLLTHGEPADVVKKIGFHYRTALVHGWKHRDED